MCSLGVYGGGELPQGHGGQEGGVGEKSMPANSLVHVWVAQADLGGQVVRECWGWEAGQGVLIIGFRTSVGSSTGALASWICQSAVQTNSGIIHVLW